jgi:Ca-activated chloride channel family protein
MMHFEWPWIFLLIPLPWLLRTLLPPADAVSDAALRVPDITVFTAGSSTVRLRRSLIWLAVLAWLLLLTAAARPVWPGDPVDFPVSGRDLMLAVDLSGSMQTRDMIDHDHAVSRLTAVKQIAGEFIARRTGDRVGLILFGSQAYIQTPLTFDRKTVNSMLQESQIGLAGEQTAIGDAIGLAVKRLMQNPQGDKVLILLTDGASNTGSLAPVKAAELAARAGLVIYTIGIGADQMQVNTLFGSQMVNPSEDLDEKTLNDIASKTGGQYFRARDGEQLEKIYTQLDKLQPVMQDKQTYRPQHALFYWPLGLFLLLSCVLVLRR